MAPPRSSPRSMCKAAKSSPRARPGTAIRSFSLCCGTSTKASRPHSTSLPLIIDNYATHKHPKVRAWLAVHPRYHVHYTPTYSSWLNQVERWFGLITQQSIRRGSFSNVKELVQRLDAYVKSHNRHAGPLQWTTTADSILAKFERVSKVISGTQH